MFNKLCKEGQKVYLADEFAHNERCSRLDTLQSIYNEIRVLLDSNQLPTSEVWIRSIVEEGKDGLLKCVIDETERRVNGLGLPPFMVASIKRSAPGEIPAEVWNKAEELKREFVQNEDGLPGPLPTHYDESAGVVIDSETVKDEIKKGTQIEVTKELQDQADELLAIAEKVKALELAGVNARELIGKYVAAPSAPDMLTRYQDITLRRHVAGQIAPPDLTPYIMAAKNAQKFTNQ